MIKKRQAPLKWAIRDEKQFESLHLIIRILQWHHRMSPRRKERICGGREATGVLKGYDALLNLVLDNATEFLRDPEDPQKMTDEKRSLGLIVARGTAITVVAPNEGIESIANPFVTSD
uniref:Sm domain-containing protein n=1 Tax=Ditylenchus dipsaci TaxID=166011 RepID=A0A915E5N4_9BILA